MKRDSLLFRCLKKFYYIWANIPLFFLHLAPKGLHGKICETYLGQVCSSVEKKVDYYTQFRLIQKTSNQYNIPPMFKYDLSDVAIVLQGPIDTRDDFTLETVKIYRKLYSGITIIVSTWTNESISAVEALEDAGAIVVLSKTPDQSGIGNVNFQIVSSRAGIAKAIELGARFVCKSRTDQRVTRVGAFAALKTLVNELPIGDGVKDQLARVIGLGYMGSGGMTAPFRISDFLYFGLAKDIQAIFELDLDARAKDQHECIRTTKQWLEEKGDPEILLYTSFVERMKACTDLSIDEYLTFAKDNMLVTDIQQLGLYWHKYDDRYREHKRDGSCDILDSSEYYLCFNFDSLQWLSLYGGVTTVEESLLKFENKRYPIVTSVSSLLQRD